MRPNDYITSEDVLSLSESDFESLLNYIKFIGINVLVSSHWRNYSNSNHVLFLDDRSNLEWSHVGWLGNGGSRIPLDEVKRMAALGMVV